MSAHSHTREEIFDAVWARPLGQVAADYGITGTGLAKLCDRHDIPRPPQGHWVRADNGKASPRPALPSVKPGRPTLIRIVPSVPDTGSAKGLDLRSAEAGLTIPEAALMTVGKRLSKPHAFFQGWLDTHEQDRIRARTSSSGWDLAPRPWSELDRRRLRILNTIFRTLESVGVAAEYDRDRGLEVCYARTGSQLRFGKKPSGEGRLH